MPPGGLEFQPQLPRRLEVLPAGHPGKEPLRGRIARDRRRQAVELRVDVVVGTDRLRVGHPATRHCMRRAQIERAADDHRSVFARPDVVERDPDTVDPQGDQFFKRAQGRIVLVCLDSAGNGSVDEHSAAMRLVDDALRGRHVDLEPRREPHRGIAVGSPRVAHVGEVQAIAGITVKGPGRKMDSHSPMGAASPADAGPIANRGQPQLGPAAARLEQVDQRLYRDHAGGLLPPTSTLPPPSSTASITKRPRPARIAQFDLLPGKAGRARSSSSAPEKRHLADAVGRPP